MAVNELDDDLRAEVQRLAAALTARGWMLATAESCTGGLIAAACTAQAGSSDWFERGVVSYSNQAKTELLDVPAELIARHGAVSGEVARAMAEGALARSRAQIAVAVTGIAGPAGGSPEKPVGTVWVGLAEHGAPGTTQLMQLQGDRAAVRRQTVLHALQLLNRQLAR
ncbi:MAG TPA: CinA family protein [Albitalea sp.]